VDLESSGVLKTGVTKLFQDGAELVDPDGALGKSPLSRTLLNLSCDEQLGTVVAIGESGGHR
jgi:hypothetical protein